MFVFFSSSMKNKVIFAGEFVYQFCLVGMFAKLKITQALRQPSLNGGLICHLYVRDVYYRPILQ